MFLIIAIVLGILWLLGIVVVHISSPLLHLLLVIAIIIFIYDLLSRRGKT